MKINKFFICASIVIASVNAKAQTLAEAMGKTENERFDLASADFKKLILATPTNGDLYFYYGENFFRREALNIDEANFDSANVIYTKGVEVNATNPLNYIGLGKVALYKGDDKTAATQFFKAKELSKNKNAVVLMKIAEAYTNAPVAKNATEAIKLLTEAQKLDAKSAEACILMGDAILLNNAMDGGPAVKQYEKALTLDPKSAKAQARQGKIYVAARNPIKALEYYAKAEAIDKTYAPIYREQATLWNLAGQNAKALENYRKYIDLNPSSWAKDKFIQFLFLSNLHKEACSEYEKLVASGYSSIYSNRVAAYSYYEMGNKEDVDAYKKGLTAINKFFDAAAKEKNFQYIFNDYRTKGMLLSKNGSDSLGLIELEKAVEFCGKSTNPKELETCSSLYTDMAKVYNSRKNYDKAISCYEKKAASQAGLSTSELFEMGTTYYKKKDFVNADTCFSRVIRKSPTTAATYFWKARCNTFEPDQKNPKWLAKPIYEQYVGMIKVEDRAKNKANLVEAYSYLGVYYNKMKDSAKAKEMYTIVKELDPTNKEADAFFKSPAGK